MGTAFTNVPLSSSHSERQCERNRRLLKSLWFVDNDYFNMCYLKGETVVRMWIMVWIIPVRS